MKINNVLTITGWKRGRATAKFPYSYRLILDGKWETEARSYRENKDDFFDSEIGKDVSKFDVVLSFGSEFRYVGGAE